MDGSDNWRWILPLLVFGPLAIYIIWIGITNIQERNTKHRKKGFFYTNDPSKMYSDFLWDFPPSPADGFLPGSKIRYLGGLGLIVGVLYIIIALLLIVILLIIEFSLFSNSLVGYQ